MIDGTISVTLTADTADPINYTVATTSNNSTSVNVFDDDTLPVISIVADNGDVAESAGQAQFMLTATEFRTDSRIFVNATPFAVNDSTYLSSGVAGTDDDFEVTFTDPDNDGIFEGLLTLTLDNDLIGDVTGDIRIRLNANPTSYRLGTTTEGVITVWDDDAPELDIKALTPTITEANGVMANFEFSAEVSPNEEVTIRYNLVDSHDFISIEGSEKTSKLDFRGGTNGVTEVTLPIPITSDTTGEENGTITLTLIEEETPATSYTVAPSPNNTAVINVIDDDAKVLSISAGDAVIEGNNVTADFKISAESSPNSTVRVQYELTESHDFIDNEGPDKEAVLDFTNGATEDTLSIDIFNDGVDEPNGTITVTLTPDTADPITYKVATAPNNSDSVTVYDDEGLPIVSMVPTSGSVAESAGIAQFMLTATGLSVDNTPLLVNATPAEDTGDFLTDAIAGSPDDFSVIFSDLDRDNIYTGFFEVALHNDDIGEATGDIKLSLNANPTTYQIGSVSEGTISILDDDAPEITLSANFPTVTEAEDAEAIFTISAQVSPRNTYSLHYNVSVSTDPNVGDFIDSMNLGDDSKMIDLTSGKTDTIKVDIENDGLTENDSIVYVRLLPETGGIQHYTVDPSLPSNGVTINITDDESLPLLTIANTTTATAENVGEIDFTLSTTADPGPNLVVRYQPAEVDTGDFLDSASDNNQEDIDTQSVDFSTVDGGATYTGTLTVPIHNDQIGENTGQIQVTLLTQTEIVKTYQVNSSNNVGMATIWDDDAPIISIEDAPAVVESDNAEIQFPLTALVSPNATINVYYELTESADSDDGDFIEVGEEGAGEFKSVNFTNNATTSVLAIPIESDEVQERNSTVAVTLESQPGELATAKYNLPTTNDPVTATVSDDDLPEVSIETRYTRVSDSDFVEYTVTATSLTFDSIDVTLSLNTGASIVNTTTSDSLTINLTNSAPSATQSIRFNTGIANDSLVEVGIASGTYYTIDSEKSQISFQVDNGTNLPPVSIFGADSVSEGAVANFTVSTVRNPTSPLVVYIAVSETTTNFLANIDSPTATIFPGKNWITYKVPTLSDGVAGGNNGTITISILPGPHYKRATTGFSTTTTIMDDGSSQEPFLSVSIIAPRSALAGEPFDVTFKATPALGSGESLVINYRVTQRTAGTNYLNHTPAAVTITDANSSETTISVNTHRNGDGDTDRNAWLDFLVTAGASFTTSPTGTGVEILDPDLLPEVSVTRISSATIEEGEQAIFELSATSPVLDMVNLPVTYKVEKSGTGDFIDAGEFGIKSNEIDHTTNKYRIELDTIPDADAEDSGTITITVQEDPKKSNPSQDATYILGGTITQSLTINDNDGMGLGVATVSRGTERVYEGENAEFTFDLSNPPTGEDEVTIFYKVVETGLYLTNRIDPTSRQSINIDSTGSATLTLPTTSDIIEENNGSVMVQILSEIGGATNYSVGVNYQDTITLISDDNPGITPSVEITASPRTITEGTHDRASFTIIAMDGNVASERITINLEIKQEGQFLRDDPDTRAVPITTGINNPHYEYILDDNFDEPNGRIIATILPDKTGPVDYAIGEVRTIDVTVMDEDESPTISINDPSAVMEGDETSENVTITFDVTLSAPSLHTIEVDYEIGKMGDTATETVDYVDGSDTLTFDPMETRLPIIVMINEEELYEGDEQFTIVLSDATTGITIAKNEGIGTITNDDPIPTISVASLSERIGEESGTLTIPVTLSNPTKESVMIDWSITPDTASASDYSIDPTKQSPLVINSGETTGNIEINITSDTEVEGNETFVVELNNPRHAQIIGDHGTRSIDVTIWDNESLQTFSIFAVGGQSSRSICGSRPSTETQYLDESNDQHSDYRELLANRNLGAKGCQQEGTNVQFRVIASSPPAVDVPLRIAVSQVGDFILAPTAGSNPLPEGISLAEGINNVIFKAGRRTETFIVHTKKFLTDSGDRVGIATGDGKITAELQTDFTNTRNPKAISADVTIWDIDRPRISIEPISVSGVEEGTEAKFKISADPFPTESSFEVRVNISEPKNEDFDFLMSSEEGEKTVRLTPKTETVDGTEVIVEYTGELIVPTQPDDADEPNGYVVATILTSTTYNINPSPEYKTAVVRVRDNDGIGADTNDLPLVSIAPVSANPIIEGGIAQFTLTATEAVDTAYTIEIGLTNTGGDFIDRSATNVTHITNLTERDENNNLIVVPVSFVITQVEMPANRSSVGFSIQTLGDQIEEPDGSIIANIVVDNSDRYRIFTSRTGTAQTPLTNPLHQFTNSATVQVLDDDTVPEISISAISNGPITEGTNAEFTISANRLSLSDKVIQVNHDDGDGNFIDSDYFE